LLWFVQIDTELSTVMSDLRSDMTLKVWADVLKISILPGIPDARTWRAENEEADREDKKELPSRLMQAAQDDEATLDDVLQDQVSTFLRHRQLTLLKQCSGLCSGHCLKLLPP
jgi:hypothetical protein